MPTANELRDQVWAAMGALPKPVTRDAALAAATGVLANAGKESGQFMNWWLYNADYVLERLNGN